MTLFLLVLIALGIALCVTGLLRKRSARSRRDLVPLATVWQPPRDGRARRVSRRSV